MRPPARNSLAGEALRKTLKTAISMPEGLVERVFGEPPRNDRGAALDHQVHALLQILETVGTPKPEELGAVEAREVYRRSNRLFDLDSVELHGVEDREIPGPAAPIPIRVYRPTPEADSALVFFHGGGYVIGSLDGYDGLCRRLSEATGRVVISVDYRLAPEDPFPAAVDDTVAAYRWVVDEAEQLGIEPDSIAVGGDSAGGNLATVTCQKQHVDGRPQPSSQLLLYPATDETQSYPSAQHFSEGYLLTESMMDWFIDCYLGDADRHDSRVSPILFDSLGELAPATVITAGFDPLRDEGEAYAAKLEAAGVDVTLRCYEHLIHGFVTMGGVIDAAEQALSEIAADFNETASGAAPSTT